MSRIVKYSGCNKQERTFKGQIIKLYKDGNMWCCMHGTNIQEGVAGFGKTKGIAIADYCRAMNYDFVKHYALAEDFGLFSPVKKQYAKKNKI